MDKYTIGNDGKRWKYEDLKAASALSDRDLNAAIGWLAREDKIYFETDSNNAEYLYLSLNIYY